MGCIFRLLLRLRMCGIRRWGDSGSLLSLKGFLFGPMNRVWGRWSTQRCIYDKTRKVASCFDLELSILIISSLTSFMFLGDCMCVTKLANLLSPFSKTAVRLPFDRLWTLPEPASKLRDWGGRKGASGWKTTQDRRRENLALGISRVVDFWGY
jgi:hypothetical protein